MPFSSAAPAATSPPITLKPTATPTPTYKPKPTPTPTPVPTYPPKPTPTPTPGPNAPITPTPGAAPYQMGVTPHPGGLVNESIPPAGIDRSSLLSLRVIEVWADPATLNDSATSIPINFNFTSPFGHKCAIFFKVYDADNRLITTSFAGYFAPGEYHMFEWPGTDDDGDPLPDGKYRIEVEAEYTTYMYERQWGSAGSGDGEFQMPLGIAIGPDGNVYVSDFYRYNVQVFDRNGNFVRKFGPNYPDTGFLGQSKGITLDGEGNVYVVSTTRGQVLKYSPEGEYLQAYGRHVESLGDLDNSGELLSPFGVAIDSNFSVLLVTDPAKGTIERYGLSGASYSSLIDFRFGKPGGITSKGNFFGILDQNRDYGAYSVNTAYYRWQVFGSGLLVAPMGIATDNNGKIYVCDAGADCVTVFDPLGRFLYAFGGNGSREGAFSNPYGIAVDGDGNIYVADTYNSRVQKFEPRVQRADNSTTVRVNRTYPPDTQYYSSSLILSLRDQSQVPEWVYLSGTYLPATPTPVPGPSPSVGDRDIPADQAHDIAPVNLTNPDDSFVPLAPMDVDAPLPEALAAFLATTASAGDNASTGAGEPSPTPVPAPASASPASPGAAWALAPASLFAVAVAAALRGRRKEK